MLKVTLSALIRRLHPMTREALEAAAGLAIEHRAPEVRAGHLLGALLEQPLSDVRGLLADSGLDPAALRSRILADAAPLVPADDQTPGFSPLLVALLQDAWLLASTELEHTNLRSGPILLALLHQPDRYLGGDCARRLVVLDRHALLQRFSVLTAGSAEQTEPARHDKGSPAVGGSDSALARFSHSLTWQAKQGELDPVLCRDHEIDQMVDILARRRKNNPIIVGDAGVGKSALVEGLAARIVADQVPGVLRGVDLRVLDLGALQAGAAVKGEFEKRLKAVVNEAREASHPVLLFIDEAHTLIGAGNPVGGGDAANLLKPALARGELRTIAATTWREYKQYFEKDPALTRRFQPVAVAEPDPAQALVILRGLRDAYERSHGVLIGDSALRAAAELSARYLAGRQLPDKAIDVLDTACARVSQALQSPPRQLAHLESELAAVEREVAQVARETLLGRTTTVERRQALDQHRESLCARRTELASAWQAQREQVDAIVASHRRLLSEPPMADVDREALIAELARQEEALASLQSRFTLVNATVEAPQVARVIEDWTGVPVNRMSRDEFSRLACLPDLLGEEIKGQDEAIARIHRHLLTARADLRRPDRPTGAFLLVGPSGVGKTETVHQLAEQLYGGRSFLTTVNLSEYQEKHSVARLIGAPPGYVGFGEGGLLTEALRQRPYSVVLLDEAEKAHPDVLNLFYQVFDKGELADGEGRRIDCRNAVFFLTSNLGQEQILRHRGGAESLDRALHPLLADFFKPALLARVTVVPFRPLPRAVLEQIVTARLAGLVARIRHRHAEAEVELDPELSAAICQRATQQENGARMLDAIIEGELLPPVSRTLLQLRASKATLQRLVLAVDQDSGAFRAEVA